MGQICLKSIILVLGGKEIVTNLYCSLEGQRHKERETQTKPVGHVYVFICVVIQETALLKWQPMEIKYLQLWLLNLLGNSDIQQSAKWLRVRIFKGDKFETVRVSKT